MKSNNYLFYIIIYLLCANSVYTQEDCLSIIQSESIISISEDDKYLWCGTKDHGLLRIDKSSNTQKFWNTANSNISSNKIKSVIPYEGKTYFSSDSSLMYIQDDQLIELNDSISGLLLKDSEANLLVGGDRVFYKLSPDGSITYSQNLMEFISDECCAETTDIYLDSDDNIWLSHKDFYRFDIFKLNLNTWSVFNKSNSNLPIESPFPNQITSIGDEVYITSANGLHRNIDDEWISVHSDDNPSIQNDEDNVDELWIMPLESNQNNLWIAANDYYPMNTGKIAYRISENWHFIEGDALQGKVINTIQQSAFDPNIMFVGTSKGLVIIDKDCLGIITSSLEENRLGSINLYPNPAIESIHFKSETKITFLEIYDSNGHLHISLNNPSSPVSLASLNKGSYVVKIYSGNHYDIQKIVIGDL